METGELFGWCERFKLDHGTNPTLEQLAEGTGHTGDDVRAEAARNPRIGLRGNEVRVAPRRFIGVELRSKRTDSVPDGARHMFAGARDVDGARAVGQLLLGRRSRPSAYYAHYIGEGDHV